MSWTSCYSSQMYLTPMKVQCHSFSSCTEVLNIIPFADYDWIIMVLTWLFILCATAYHGFTHNPYLVWLQSLESNSFYCYVIQLVFHLGCSDVVVPCIILFIFIWTFSHRIHSHSSTLCMGTFINHDHVYWWYSCQDWAIFIKANDLNCNQDDKSNGVVG